MRQNSKIHARYDKVIIDIVGALQRAGAWSSLPRRSAEHDFERRPAAIIRDGGNSEGIEIRSLSS